MPGAPGPVVRLLLADRHWTAKKTIRNAGTAIDHEIGVLNRSTTNQTADAIKKTIATKRRRLGFAPFQNQLVPALIAPA